MGIDVVCFSVVVVVEDLAQSDLTFRDECKKSSCRSSCSREGGEGEEEKVRER